MQMIQSELMMASCDKSPEISDLEAHLGYWLRYVSNHVSESFQKRLEAFDVTVAEWAVMRTIYTLNSAAPSQVAETMGMSRGALSKLIERLVKKSLATRQYSTSDRRYQEVTLTASGTKLVPQLAQAADENDQHYFSHLSPQHHEQLKQLLMETVRVHQLRQIPTT